MKAPKAKKIDTILSKHEDQRIDPYYWLNERENPEVTEYLNEENTYAFDSMKDTEEFQNMLYEEMKARYKKTMLLFHIFLTNTGILCAMRMERNILFLPETSDTGY